MIFVVHRLDAPGKSDLRQQHRAAHLEYLARFQDNILAAGPYLDEDAGEDRGSLFLVTFETLDQAWAFANDDPFTTAGIFSELQVWPWTQRIGRLAVTD